ncbi:MAG TPA: amine oxidase, partial [Burkholderiaceae bacterium]|nr:amine oxidase [Burkholderiaceae bacterium]
MSGFAGDGLLRSFWLGGFEGADHVNAAGQALDMVQATGHLDRLEEDYRRAARLGLRTLRESVGWRLCEGAGGALDLSRAVRQAQAARAAGIQPLWTLMHYGLPPDLSLFDDALVERFARFAGAVACALRPLCPAPRFYTPVNEISFLAWAASTGGLLGGNDGGVAAGDGTAAGSELSGYQ